MFPVEVFGTDRECSLLAAAVRKAADFVGIAIKLVRVERPDQIAARGVATTPAVAVDGAIKCQGSVPSQADLTTWLTTAALKYETV